MAFDLSPPGPSNMTQIAVSPDWDLNGLSSIQCSSNVYYLPDGKIASQPELCFMPMDGVEIQGAFDVRYGASSAMVYGWMQNASALVISVDGELLNLTPYPAVPAELDALQRQCPRPWDCKDLLPFAALVRLRNTGGQRNTVKLKSNLGSTTVVVNITIAYPPVDDAAPTPRPTNIPAIGTGESEPSQAPTAIGSSSTQTARPSAGGHHHVSAGVIVAAVICGVVAVVGVALVVVWWLRYRRRLAPSAAFRANPETAWVPIDEKREPALVPAASS